MGTEIKSGWALSKSVRRIVDKRSERILKRLGKKNAGGLVHDTRKDLKKIRAVLRLARKALRRKDCDRLNYHLREAGRVLSPMRDARVLSKAANDLRAPQRNARANAALSKLQRFLLRREDEAFRESSHLAHCRASVLKAQDVDVSWSGLRWNDLNTGLARSCRREGKAFKAAKKSAAPENLHEWRKRIKDWWYQLKLIKAARPGAISQIIRRLKKISESLGEDHDLYMLQHELKTTPLSVKEKEALAHIIVARRDCLERWAFRQAKKLSASNPRKLMVKIGRGHKGKKF